MRSPHDWLRCTPVKATPEQMLEEIEKLDASMELKLAHRKDGVPVALKRKLEDELRPRLEECRALVARGGSRAKNACMDTLVLYRELAFTAFNVIVTPNF
jgi:hypothetical protein